MRKVKIVYKDNYDYILEDINGSKYNLNISFIGDVVPGVNDYIYLSDDILREVNIYTFGPLKDDINLSDSDIIKAIIGDCEYYFQRYYG